MTGVQTCALRSEEHTSELQSHDNLVCRLLLEKKTDAHPLPAPVGHGADTLRPPPAPRRAQHARSVARRHGQNTRRRPRRAALVIFFLNDGATPEINPLPLHTLFPT